MYLPPELRALRQIQRDYADTSYVFVSERKAPLSTRSIRHIIARAGELAGLPFKVHPHQLRHGCGYYLAAQGHDTRLPKVMILERFRIVWDIKTSITRFTILRCHPKGLKTSGWIK